MAVTPKIKVYAIVIIPPSEGKRGIMFYPYPSVRPSVFPSFRPSVRLSVLPSVRNTFLSGLLLCNRFLEFDIAHIVFAFRLDDFSRLWPFTLPSGYVWLNSCPGYFSATAVWSLMKRYRKDHHQVKMRISCLRSSWMIFHGSYGPLPYHQAMYD